MSICTSAPAIIATVLRSKTYGDGVTVTKGDTGSKLECRRPGVAEGNHTVETELVQVGGLELSCQRSLNSRYGQLGLTSNMVSIPWWQILVPASLTSSPPL